MFSNEQIQGLIDTLASIQNLDKSLRTASLFAGAKELHDIGAITKEQYAKFLTAYMKELGVTFEKK